MATVEVSRSSLGLVGDVGICIVTGHRTTNTVRVSGWSSPRWVASLLPFSVAGTLIAQRRSRRGYTIIVPWAPEAVGRYRRARRYGWALAGLAVLASAALALLGAGASAGPVLLVVGSSTLVLLLANEYLNCFGIRVSGSESFALTRVHPDFAAGLMNRI